MKRIVLVLIVSSILGMLLYVPVKGQPLAKGKGPHNNDSTVWLVKYHKDQPNDRHKGIAVRMKVTIANNRMTADLKIYKELNATETKYSNTNAVVINGLEGPAPTGDGSDRRRLDFVLTKTGESIVVKGFFHTGRDRQGMNDRHDDVMVIRIIDTGPNRKPSDPSCDETPPDEDVLEEDSDADPPNYP